MQELAAKEDNAEIRQRAAAIARQIAVADVTKPTRVTLKFKDAPVRQVYEELFKQAGADQGDAGRRMFDRAGGGRRRAAAPTVTVDLKDVTFWEAVLALEPKTGLMIESFAGELQLKEIDRIPGERRLVSASGPFLVMGDEMSTAFGELHGLKVLLEPRIKVVSHASQPEFAPAAGGAGGGGAGGGGADGALMRLRRARGGLVGGGRPGAAAVAAAGEALVGDRNHGFDLHFVDAPAGDGPVKGIIRALVVTREQTIEFDNIAKANNVEKVVEGRRVMLNAMNPAPGQWFITAVLYNTVPPSPGGLFSAKFTLLDAKGGVLQNHGHSAGGGEQYVAFSLEFKAGPNVGPPVKLRLTLPAETREVEIPFEFKR
jgi:hypothetical protein